MKKSKRIMVILLSIFMFLMLKKVNAATSATVFTGESIEIEKIDSVEIISNDLNVDVNTSKVTNNYLFKNKEDNELITKITAKLEDEKSNFTIKDLVIKVNNLEIKNIEKEQDSYSFYVKIQPEEYEKIEINYTTENDLKNAKVIKYTLDNFKDKEIKKFNIDVTIPEEDVPLVKKIYPGCFEFDEDKNDININYYDFTVNNLTKDFIIEKETWNNLNHGEDVIKDDLQSALYKNARELMSTNLDVKWDKYIVDYSIEGISLGLYFDENGLIADYFNIKIPEEHIYSYVYSTPPTHDSILAYVIYKQANNDNLKQVKNTFVAKYVGDYPLTKYIVDRYSYSDVNGNLVGKKICIDYVRSEGDKELYIGARGITAEPPKRRFDEFELLRKRATGDDNGAFLKYIYGPEYAYRTINVGLDINENEIDATEEEKVEYINKIGADLYIRKVIYDGNTKITFVSEWDGEEHESDLDMVVAYYTDKNKEVANSYLGEKNEWQKVLKFENEIVSNNSKVPTIVSSVGYRTTENGKYMINFFNHYVDRFDALGYIGEAINTNDAKSLIESNNEENEKTREKIEEEIKNVKITEDTEEFDINKKDIIMQDTQVDETTEKTGKNIKLSKNEIIIIAFLGFAIFINIIVIIRNKRRRTNG